MTTKIMLIAAHPDDAELAMGGTIAALNDDGKDLVLVDLTDGEPTPYGNKEIRQRETATASQILGIRKRILLNLPNRSLADTVEARTELAALIREHKPELLFVPYWDDAHPDHIAAAKLSVAARFYAKFVKTDMPHEPHYPRKIFHYYNTHMRVKFNPSFIFDISKTIDRKISALAAYRSQFVDNPKNHGFLERIQRESAYWGSQIGVEYGEPFICKENIRIKSTAALLEA